MGFFIRKSFSTGPLRLNLSKSGFGLSAGVKGARVSVGPRGTLLHAGRHGLYYRKSLSGSGGRAASAHTPAHGHADARLGCEALPGMVVLAVIAVAGALMFPRAAAALGAVALAAILAAAAVWWVRRSRERRLAAYKAFLDRRLVTAASASPETAGEIRRLRDALHAGADSRNGIAEIEAGAYQALLDRVLYDESVSAEEAALLALADDALDIPASEKLRIKREVFEAAYLDVVADKHLTDHEIARLRDLIAGLHIPRELIQAEIHTLREIHRAQNLVSPLKPLPRDKVPVGLRQREQAYHVTRGDVLTRRKAKDAPKGVEFTTQRSGTLVVTDKRVLVAGAAAQGSTNIRLSEIADVDVDLDEHMIIVSKTTSERPVFLKSAEPVVTARIIDLAAAENMKGTME